jgi:hypothetical protein
MQWGAFEVGDEIEITKIWKLRVTSRGNYEIVNTKSFCNWHSIASKERSVSVSRMSVDAFSLTLLEG